MLIALVLVLWGAGASAEPATDAERDKLAAQLRAGADAAKRKDWAACIAAYSAALELEETAPTTGALGVCEEAAGRDIDAYRHLAAAMHSAGADEKAEPFRSFAGPFARVSVRVAHVFIAVDPPQARVVVDSRPLGKAEGRSVILLPGVHTFVARLDGYEDASETRELKGGDMPSIYLSLRAKPRAAQAVPVAPLVTPKPLPVEAPPAWYAPAWDARGVLATLTYVSGATLLASGATAIGLEVNRADLRKGLPEYACGAEEPSPPSQCATLHERRFQRNAAVNVVIGSAITTGVLAAATSVAIYLDRGPNRPKIAPSVSAQGGGIVVSGAW